MKGALACYLAALDALRSEELRGDVVVAAVCGEIEKTQYGDAQGAEYRGYAAGTRHLVTHGGVADMCLLGEPTEGKVVLGHFGSLWARIGVGGDFVHTAFSEGRANSVLRMGELLADPGVVPSVGGRRANAYRGVPAIASVGAIRGGFEWRAVADAAADERLPRRPRAADEGDGRGAARGARRWGATWRRGIPTGTWTRRSTSRRPAPRSTRGTSSWRDRRGARGGLRRAARARRPALVLRRVGARRVRRPDGELRHVDAG